MAAADHVLLDPRQGETPPLLRMASPSGGPPAVARAPEADFLPGTAPLRLTVSHDLAAVEAVWRRFEQTADGTVFQCYDWLATWQRHVGAPAGFVPAIVIGWRAADAPLFLLPLATRRRGGIRRLTFLGHTLCDYNAPLLAPDFTERGHADRFPALWGAIAALLNGDPRHRHDVVALDKMPETVGAQPNPFLALKPSLNASGAYRAHLGANWETFYAERRSASARRRDRNKRRRLADHGPVAMVTPTGPAAVAATLDALIAQKRSAFARMGVADLFAKPGHEDFFRAVAALPAEQRLAHVSRLDIGAACAAANLGLRFRGIYYHVLTSYDDGPLSRFGPGAVHLQALMRHAVEEGCTVFDFTIGDEPYKREWSDQTMRLYDWVSAASVRGLAVATGLRLARAVKRGVKQSRFWPALTRLRTALAGGARSPAPPAEAE